MATTNKYQGDDITLSITVGSTPENIDNLAEVFVYIVSKLDGTVLIKFNKAGSTGFTALLKVSTTVYEAIIPSSITKDARGSYQIEGNVAVTDSDYESSQENAITFLDSSDEPEIINVLISTSKASSSG